MLSGSFKSEHCEHCFVQLLKICQIPTWNGTDSNQMNCIGFIQFSQLYVYIFIDICIPSVQRYWAENTCLFVRIFSGRSHKGGWMVFCLSSIHPLFGNYPATDRRPGPRSAESGIQTCSFLSFSPLPVPLSFQRFTFLKFKFFSFKVSFDTNLMNNFDVSISHRNIGN